jgi:hypothetical protein
MNSSWCVWSIPFHKQFHSRPQNLRCDLTVPYFCFPPFECLSVHHSSDGFGDQLTAVLHAGSWVICHSFLNLCLCFSRLSRPGRLLFRFRSIIYLVDSLYAGAIEATKLRATLSASSSKLIWILGEINSEGRFWTTPNLWICQPGPKDS